MAGEIVKLRNGLKCEYLGYADYKVIDTCGNEVKEWYVGDVHTLLYPKVTRKREDPLTHTGGSWGKEFDVVEIISWQEK